MPVKLNFKLTPEQLMNLKNSIVNGPLYRVSYEKRTSHWTHLDDPRASKRPKFKVEILDQ